MRKKFFTATSLVSLIALLALVSSVFGANLNVLNLDVTTDKTSYEYNEEITSTINITNTSETNYATNIQVSAIFDEQIELVNSEELTVEDGRVVWRIEAIEEGEELELIFQTKLNEPEEEPKQPDPEPTSTEDVDGDDTTVIISPEKDDKDQNELKAPQTGDESSIFMYVVILIASIAMVLFAFVAIKQKRVSKVAVLLLASTIIAPTFVSSADSVTNTNYVQSITEKYNVEIAGTNYEYEITITAEVPDDIQVIEADPNEMTLTPEGSQSFTVTGTKASGDVVDLVEDENLSFEVSESDKVVVVVGEEGLEVHATAAAEVDDEITITVTYVVNGVPLTDTITVTIEEYVGTLAGQVFDAFTEEPIEGATVIATAGEDVSGELTTNENGEYRTEIGAGTYTATASADGYISESETVVVSPNHVGTDDVNFYLIPEELAGEGTASGQIQNALTGEGVEGVLIEVVKGKNNSDGDVIATTTTDEDGNYSVDLEAGNYTLLISAEGYIPNTKNIIVVGNTNTDNQNATITPILSDEEYRIVLTWGETPHDLDSHFTGPKADDGRFHVYWGDRDYVDEHSEVNLDLDDVWSFGPETITIVKSISDGTYTYDVFNYSGWTVTDENKLDLAKSNAKVEVYQGNALIKTYNVPTNREGNIWRVFQIVDGEIVNVNKVETFINHPDEINLAP